MTALRPLAFAAGFIVGLAREFADFALPLIGLVPVVIAVRFGL